jgi:esterase/lipase superfamily enzyme
MMKLQYWAIIVFAFYATSAVGQQTSIITSEPCVAARAEDPKFIETKKSELTGAIARIQARLEMSPADDSLKQELARTQGELIELLYKLDCFRPDLEPEPGVKAGDSQVVDVTTFYATNRKPSGLTAISDFYGTEDSRQLSYGRTTVSIPSKHRMGDLELPQLWKLERTPDPSKHFVVTSIDPLDTAMALSLLEESVGNSRDKSLLLFVHGFNVSFIEAALRTAQLTHDLRFPGIAMFYSWPSAGSFWGYLHDEESAELAKRLFTQLLDDISRLNVDNIYIVAHSMGNRIVGSVLASKADDKKLVGRIREILLAAPDINATVFKEQIAPQLEGLQSAHKTIYASSSDLALAASKVVHGFRRVGESTGGVLTFPGIDTVDASKTAPVVRAFGHSYILDSISVLNDVEDQLVWQRSLTERKLMKAGMPPDAFWTLN